MKVIIAGGRTFNDLGALDRAIEASGFEITEVITGGARGADTLAIRWAKAHDIPVSVYWAQWDIYGKRAGPLRNWRMTQFAEALIALPGGLGTADMIMQARRKGLPVFEAS